MRDDSIFCMYFASVAAVEMIPANGSIFLLMWLELQKPLFILLVGGVGLV